MVLLTDLDGLFTSDPTIRHRRRVRVARRRRRPVAVDPCRRRRQRPRQRRHGQQAVGGAHRIVVGSAHRDRQGRASTKVLPRGGRRRWSRHHLRRPRPSAAGSQAVDRLRGRGAWSDRGRRRRQAWRSPLVRTSLLPAGVREVVGSFGEGDTVEVRSTDGSVFARGMVYVTAARSPHRGGHADPRPTRRNGSRGDPPRRPRGAARADRQASGRSRRARASTSRADGSGRGSGGFEISFGGGDDRALHEDVPLAGELVDVDDPGVGRERRR